MPLLSEGGIRSDHLPSLPLYLPVNDSSPPSARLAILHSQHQNSQSGALMSSICQQIQISQHSEALISTHSCCTWRWRYSPVLSSSMIYTFQLRLGTSNAALVPIYRRLKLWQNRGKTVCESFEELSRDLRHLPWPPQPLEISKQLSMFGSNFNDAFVITILCINCMIY